MTNARLSIIPARAATDRALKPRDLQVLCVLGRHTDDHGWCRRSQVRMADEMACARSTVFEAIERLIKAGYLERHEHETVNGRDSAHSYRVMLDPVHPAIETICDREPVDKAGDEQGIDPCRYIGTPAGISAPPAGPEPAPPAGPGPAPINDPYLTTPSELEEKARARIEDRKQIERWLKRVHPDWPSYVSDSAPKALTAAVGLSADDRDEAVARMADYLAQAKVGGRTVVCTFAVYLAEKRWEKLPAAAEKPFDEFATPFSKAWSAWIIAHLLTVPSEPGKGWPMVAGLYRKAGLRQGAKFARRWHELGAALEPVPVGSEAFEAWRREFERRGWPWMPDPGTLPVVHLPKGGPDGLMAFEAAVAAGSDGTV